MSNLEEELAASLAKEMQKTMDYDILCDVLIRFGYTVIEIDYNTDQPWTDVKAWVDKNCQGDHKEHLGKWLFELNKDAVIFALKWLK